MDFDPDPARALLRLGAQDDTADFRPGQLEAIRHVVTGAGRLLVVRKTGWGKSFVYFIGIRMLREAGLGLGLLVSPLLSLMRNQIDDMVDSRWTSPLPRGNSGGEGARPCGRWPLPARACDEHAALGQHAGDTDVDADAALVVDAAAGTGGTWAGAEEELKQGSDRVFVRSTLQSSAGLTALQERGATAWPNPEEPDALQGLFAALGTADVDRPGAGSPGASGTVQETSDSMQLEIFGR